MNEKDKVIMSFKHFKEIIGNKFNDCPHYCGFHDFSVDGCCLKCGPAMRKKCWEYAIEWNNKKLED